MLQTHLHCRGPVLVCGLFAAAARARRPGGKRWPIGWRRAQDALIETYDDPTVGFDRSLLARAVPRCRTGSTRSPAGWWPPPADADVSLAFGRLPGPRAAGDRAADGGRRPRRPGGRRPGVAGDPRPAGRRVGRRGRQVLLVNLPERRAPAGRRRPGAGPRSHHLADDPRPPAVGRRLDRRVGSRRRADARPAGRGAGRGGPRWRPCPGRSGPRPGWTGRRCWTASSCRTAVVDLVARPWPAVAGPLASLRREVETHLPSLLTPMPSGTAASTCC